MTRVGLENSRLQALEAFDILDTAPEPAFDDIVELASQICGTPMALISLVDESRQWFKARKGVEATATPREVSFCAHGLYTESVFEVVRPLDDERFKANPLVTGDMHLRFYAGAPLRTQHGEPLGMLCVLDRADRPALTEQQRFAVTTLSNQVMAQLELRRVLAEQRKSAISLKNRHVELANLYSEQTGQLRQNEEALRQAQKMEAVGQLTGGIAHDFNNLLTGLKGCLELAQRRVKQNKFDAIEPYLRSASATADRAASLTHRLLAFSRRQSLDNRSVDVNAAITDMEDMLRRTIGPSITLRNSLAPALKAAYCDPGQFENALLNLCINARDAMPMGGFLAIETVNLNLRERLPNRRLAPGQYVCLSVSDTGTGMSPAVQARIFEPFFTTKPLGSGTGLGLSMIQGFVKQSDGDIEIESNLGHGTRVTMFIPICRGEQIRQDIASGSDQPLASSPGATVLIVDDEQSVRLVLREVLGDIGFHVLEAADATAALQALKTCGPIALMISDIGLPNGLNGRELADIARKVQPSLKVVFVTGYVDSPLLDPNTLPINTSVMLKPFTVQDIATQVTELLATPDEGCLANPQAAPLAAPGT